MKTPLLVAVGVILSLQPIHGGVQADSTFRCGSRLVSVGDKMPEVADACGEPDRIERREEGEGAWILQLYDYERDRYTAPKLIEGPLRIEVWTYDPGPHRFSRRLRFQNEELIGIETGPKER